VSDDDGYRRLREAIVTGELLPNERLVEADLGRMYGMGRAAVRIALVRLEQERLVERERHRGAKVRVVPEHEAVEILEARATLESLAARYAATRATDADVEELRGYLADMRMRLDAQDLLGSSDINAVFHRRITEISGHGTAQRLVASLQSQAVRFQYRTILSPGRPEQSYAEHAAIVEAIAAHDPAEAERAMTTHLSHVTDTLRRRTGAPLSP
jgi:DNA-binding GntR family transcriptional regulator